jgi:hypothetical protein
LKYPWLEAKLCLVLDGMSFVAALVQLATGIAESVERARIVARNWNQMPKL